jgi:hypothetical protein
VVQLWDVRLLRTRLAELGLDWQSVADRQDAAGGADRPVEVEVLTAADRDAD